MSVTALYCTPRNIYNPLTHKGFMDMVRRAVKVMYRISVVCRVMTGQREGQARPETKEAPTGKRRGFKIQNESAISFIVQSLTKATNLPVLRTPANRKALCSYNAQTHCSTVTWGGHPQDTYGEVYCPLVFLVE